MRLWGWGCCDGISVLTKGDIRRLAIHPLPPHHPMWTHSKKAARKPSQECNHTGTWPQISNLQNHEKINLSYSVFSILLWKPELTNTVVLMDAVRTWPKSLYIPIYPFSQLLHWVVVAHKCLPFSRKLLLVDGRSLCISLQLLPRRNKNQPLYLKEG